MEDKKKIITLSLIGIAILLLTVIGSAFAYFSIVNNSKGETSTTFTGVTENLAKYGIPTLNQGVGNIHVNVTVSDMSPEKIGASYWATDIEKENHKSERQNHIISTAKIEGQTTEEETYLQCTSELVITATGSLVDEDLLTKEDGTFYLGSNATSPSKVKINPTSIPLKTIVDSQKNGGYKTTIEYTIVGNSSVEITADMEIKNTKDDQTALSKKDIDITITNSNLTCSISEKPTAPGTQLEGEKFISSEPVGGMYRYQGLYTDDIKNYICLGNDCSENGNDLYRIIGITDDGEIKVIKKTALVDKLQWWSDDQTDTSWPQSLPYQALNGDNDEDPESFYSQIDERVKPYVLKKDWLYGDIRDLENTYNGIKRYNQETGIDETTRGIKNESGYFDEETYTWENSIKAYIGLQYIHDYLYAYPNGTPENGENAVNSWINLVHNEINYQVENEWLITSAGYFPYGGYNVWCVDSEGDLSSFSLNDTNAVRPTFYLSSDVVLSGEGSLTNPYTIF